MSYPSCLENMQCFKHEKCITSLVGIHEANDSMEGEDSVWGPRKRIFLLSLSVYRRFKTVLGQSQETKLSMSI